MALLEQVQQQVPHTQQATWCDHSHVVEADEAQSVPGEPGAGHANAVQREANNEEANGHLDASHNK